MVTLIWVLLLVILAAGFFLAARYLQRKTGLPGGTVIYSDTNMWGKPLEQPLFDGSLGITGKPDYILRQGGEIIPVEVKSTRAPAAPYDSHIYQLAIYCLLVEKVYQHTPKYGFLHYPGKTFQIPFTEELRSTTLTLISELHQKEHKKNIPRSHEDSTRCRRCGYKDICDQNLLKTS
jgi:CRISPR-associated exonuclease Cas4